MDNNMESLLEVFLFETNGLLTHLDEILLRCEQASDFDSDSIDEIFRIMHTIKGSSAMMQFDSMATVTHKMEDLFYYVREHGISSEYNEPLTDLMFKSSDFLKTEVEKIENNEPLITDIGSLEEEINSFLKKISGKVPEDPGAAVQAQPAAPAEQPAAEPVAASIPEAPVPAPAVPPVQAWQPAADGEEYLYPVRVFFEEETEMVHLRAMLLVHAIAETGVPVRSVPEHLDSDSTAADVIGREGLLVLFRTKEEMESSLKSIENFVYTKNYTVLSPLTQQKEQAKNIQEEKTAASSEPAANNGNGNHLAVKQNLINVNLSKLDNLMDLVGEIVITESMVTSSHSVQTDDSGVDNSYTKASRQLRKLTDELQEIVMSIRMVPISGVFQKMRRIVRDMSKNLDKDAELVLVGEDTEVDKSIVDNINDPIMHVVRNSMDHGLEDKQTRIANGKPAKGTITLTAQNTGGEILISIEDDGQGINREAVLAKAKRQGMLKKSEKEYSNREVYNFLLMPGFSTNEVVTEYSGRGVGMDVVKKNVEKVGGDVTISSEPGKGTKVLFKIPLTLAIVNGMKVSVGDTMFIVPTNNIKQLVKVTSDQVLYDTSGNEIITMRNQYYPLIRLHSVFGLEPRAKTLEDSIVVQVESHEKVYCILADDLLGEQQVVVKGLPAYLNQFNIKDTGISGGAVLGDGSISLILDVVNLYNNN
ncbi:MAG: chemotaxis protein CheW [Faecalispora sporosphaeroides]|uniref:Chemotaxis protein CheA n=1 Tax=Faecalispora sporosphaeroides TaxID=1549 RepID=A0A928KRS4_9FIRM|nr:chemotaxis protein CheA [Faecalispora sporosphaeroides]MBE6833029.1 chemotaxis protein CheA [Faecalispora sporosphaeroides]